MNRLALALAALILAFASPSAHQVADLYPAETIVTGTEEPERTRGFGIGLGDVVVKLTGDARLIDDPRLVEILRRPHGVVEWFEYEDRMKDLPVRDEQGTRERPHFLRMRFNAESVDRLLQDLGIAKWPADRPVLAVWLGIKTDAVSYLVSADGQEGFSQRAVLIERAKRRGIPIFIPSMIASTSFGDVAAAKFDSIERLSPAGSAMIAGVLSLTASGYWDITWSLRWQGATRTWARRGVTFDVAIHDGLQTSALILSGKAPQ